MRRLKTFWLIVLALAIIAGGVAAADWWFCLPPGETKSYVGSAKCAECHRQEYDRWHGSDHDLAMDLATPQTVLGDFENATVSYHGITSKFFRRGDEYFIHTDGPDGKLADFQIKYVFGVRPLQQYMVAFPDGRVQVLPFAWDVNRRRWYHLYQGSPHRQHESEGQEHAEPVRAGDWLHWTGAGQNWNYMCAECHSTNLRKSYDFKTDRYHTTFSEINVSCETCHGPGSLHARLAEDRWLFWDRRYGYGLPNLKGADSTPQLESCAPCHSRRHVVHPGFEPGHRYMDHYALSLLDEGLYFPDGQIHDEVYEYGSFLQSLMYRKGVRCTDCHDPHSVKLRAQGNSLCTRCHTPAKYDVESHHHHPAGSIGAQCVECHMPSRNYMVIDARRDHSIRVPRPDVSLDLNTPNACAGCHINKTKNEKWTSYGAWLDAAEAKDPLAEEEVRRANRWSADWIERWFPDNKHRPPHFGYTLAAARRGSLSTNGATPGNPDQDREEIVKRLAALAQDRTSAGPVVRATAVSHFDRYPTAAALSANDRALADEEPMVRLAAVRNIDTFFPTRVTDVWSMTQLEPEQREALRRQFNEIRSRAGPRLSDPLRAVRVEAVRTISIVPRAFLSDEEATAFEAALVEFYAGQEELNDQPAAHLALGVMYGNLGQFAKSIEAYQNAIRLEPDYVPARINLAQLYNYQGKNAEAEKLLREAIEHAPELPDSHYYLGMLLAEEARLDEALKSFELAVKYAPDVPRIRYNYAVALHQLGRPQEAVFQYRELLQQDPRDLDAYQGLISLFAQQGRWDDAIRAAENRAMQFPDTPEFQGQVQYLLRQKAAQERGGIGPQPPPGR